MLINPKQFLAHRKDHEKLPGKIFYSFSLRKYGAFSHSYSCFHSFWKNDSTPKHSGYSLSWERLIAFIQIQKNFNLLLEGFRQKKNLARAKNILWWKSAPRLRESGSAKTENDIQWKVVWRDKWSASSTEKSRANGVYVIQNFLKKKITKLQWQFEKNIRKVDPLCYIPNTLQAVFWKACKSG